MGFFYVGMGIVALLCIYEIIRSLIELKRGYK